MTHLFLIIGSLAIFEMTCSQRHITVGNQDIGYPPFTLQFKNMVEALLRVKDTDELLQKQKFKSLVGKFWLIHLRMNKFLRKTAWYQFIN